MSTIAERVARHREQRAAAGWKLIQFNLSPTACRALARLQGDGASKQDVINAAIICAAEDRKRGHKG